MKKTKNPSNQALTNTISLRMGDWSDDGHGKTEIVTIKTNLTFAQLNKAYSAGVKKVGFDLTDETARDYEEPWMYVEHWRCLERVGMTLKQLFDNDKYELKEAQEALDSKDDHFSIYLDAFTRAWLFIAKQGDPTFDHEVVENDQSIIEIGGYGLFC